MLENSLGAGQDDQEFRAMLESREVRLLSELRTLELKLTELSLSKNALDEELLHVQALLGRQAAPERRGSDDIDDIADRVVDLLREVGHPMHYREIESELRKRGVAGIEGKDPANALLSRYFRDERLYRPARGTYALKTKGSQKSVGARKRRRAR